MHRTARGRRPTATLDREAAGRSRTRLPIAIPANFGYRFYANNLDKLLHLRLVLEPPAVRPAQRAERQATRWEVVATRHTAATQATRRDAGAGLEPPLAALRSAAPRRVSSRSLFFGAGVVGGDRRGPRRPRRHGLSALAACARRGSSPPPRSTPSTCCRTRAITTCCSAVPPSITPSTCVVRAAAARAERVPGAARTAPPLPRRTRRSRRVPQLHRRERECAGRCSGCG